MPLSKEKKAAYISRVQTILSTYKKFFVVSVSNVGSRSLQKTRLQMRGTAEILMGKKSLLRKALSVFMEANPDDPIGCIGDYLTGMGGFVFTNSDLGEVRDMIISNKVPAPARPGAIAPKDVIVPAGGTGCDPGQTSFFQVLQLPTKIVKGQIEITTQVELIKKGDKVGASEAALLDKLNIMPFEFGLGIMDIYDNGSRFGPEVLDMDDEVLTGLFNSSIRKLAAVSLMLGYPTQVSLAHSMANAFKDLCSVVVGLDTYSFPEAEPFKAYLADPSAFMSAGGGGGGGGGDAPAESAAAAVVEEEVDAFEGGMDMFGGGGGGDY